ncbi:MAG: hypothetical protein DLM60_02565 [Pseudonocardiales bacterium]|nr:hypothetical protein [Actinomycetota bacterium]PZS23494.1 MAG: hypothetical protein DLM60_02565 [Pseudonocardiales bacterium]
MSTTRTPGRRGDRRADLATEAVGGAGRALLAEHGLQLVHDPSTDFGTHTRHGIGYVRATTASSAAGVDHRVPGVP